MCKNKVIKLIFIRIIKVFFNKNNFLQYLIQILCFHKKSPFKIKIIKAEIPWFGLPNSYPVIE